MMFGMGVIGVVFWIAVVALVVWGASQIVQSNRRQETAGRAQPQAPSSLDILKQRYARGEISTDQYHRMRRELEA